MYPSISNTKSVERLAARGHRALALRVEPFGLHRPRPTNDPMAPPGGRPADIPRRAALGAPSGAAQAALRHAQQPGQPLISAGSGLRPVASSKGARRAAFTSHRGFRFTVFVSARFSSRKSAPGSSGLRPVFIKCCALYKKLPVHIPAAPGAAIFRARTNEDGEKENEGSLPMKTQNDGRNLQSR